MTGSENNLNQREIFSCRPRSCQATVLLNLGFGLNLANLYVDLEFLHSWNRLFSLRNRRGSAAWGNNPDFLHFVAICVFCLSLGVDCLCFTFFNPLGFCFWLLKLFSRVNFIFSLLHFLFSSRSYVFHYDALSLRCGLSTTRASYDALFLWCALPMTRSSYDALSLWCALTSVRLHQIGSSLVYTNTRGSRGRIGLCYASIVFAVLTKLAINIRKPILYRSPPSAGQKFLQ